MSLATQVLQLLLASQEKKNLFSEDTTVSQPLQNRNEKKKKNGHVSD